MNMRDVLIFLAGAEFFHALSHLILPYFIKLPLHVKFLSMSFDLTSQMNTYVVIINAVIAVLLLLLARMKSGK